MPAYGASTYLVSALRDEAFHAVPADRASTCLVSALRDKAFHAVPSDRASTYLVSAILAQSTSFSLNVFNPQRERWNVY